MSMARVQLGRQGELLARQWLERAGYRMLAANYRCPWGEIDLVAEEGSELVFVEVRTRRTDSYGSPQESVTRTKAQRLYATALDYLQNRVLAEGREVAQWRIDLVSIRLIPGQSPRVDHLKHAVQL